MRSLDRARRDIPRARMADLKIRRPTIPAFGPDSGTVERKKRGRGEYSKETEAEDPVEGDGNARESGDEKLSSTSFSYDIRVVIFPMSYSSILFLQDSCDFSFTEPCEKTYCSWGATCVVSENGKPLCQCPSDCPSTPEPVCGSDNVTYTNHCHLRKTSCLERKNTREKNQGACDRSRLSKEIEVYGRDEIRSGGGNCETRFIVESRVALPD
ncbi:Agrin [Eufriesea mexicana]|nr:Agrin [Eufriesea mexicana]